MYDFVTIGSALEDISFIINRPKAHGKALFSFFEDRKIEVENAEFHLGGGGMNTAVALSELDLRVAPLIFLGKDIRAEGIVSRLVSEGISKALIEHSENEPTGVAVALITKREGKHVLFVARGANEELEIDLGKLEKVEPRWVYMTSFHGNWQEDMERVFNLKEKHNFKVALNPGQNQLSEDPEFIKSILAKVDCLLLNRKEASSLVGVETGDVADLSRNLHGMGAKMVSITEGEAGANVFDGKSLYHVDIRKVETVDTTGTGDVFGATFLGTLHKFDDIEKALKYAIVQSAQVTTEVGAQRGLVGLSTLEDLSKNIEVTKH